MSTKPRTMHARPPEPNERHQRWMLKVLSLGFLATFFCVTSAAGVHVMSHHKQHTRT